MTTILVLDDNPDIASLVRTVLERQGYEVVTGRNGREGLALLEQRTFDLIISNYMMPHMNGLTFLQHVRQHSRYIPFVLMTAHVSDIHRQAAFDGGADAFLPKPFRLAELNDILRRLDIQASPN